MNTRSYAQAARHGLLLAAAVSALLASAPAQAYTYLVRHAFAGSSTDGGNSVSSLVKVGTCYYGTTTSGGAYGYGDVFKLCGTVSTDIHDFAGGTGDGAFPHAGLAYDPVTGLLYGTTLEGGSGSASNCPDFGSCGTVYSILPVWPYTEIVIYNFGTLAGAADGYAPYAGVTYDPVSGRLFGTTTDGGNPGSSCSTSYSQCGTVYNVTTAGAETVLHAFAGLSSTPADGANPSAAPILDASGNLYGTTAEGGAACVDLQYGCGTVWEIASGSTADSILWAFAGAAYNDGAGPHSQLVLWQKALWGTTFWGGANQEGMVFKLRQVGSSWINTNIHSFTGGADGGYPEAGLTNGGKFLYGDTTLGANTSCSYYFNGGCGTIFEINWADTLTTIYTFNNTNTPPDGGSPFDTLLKSGLYLWGTTYGGGANSYGTVFKFGPVP